MNSSIGQTPIKMVIFFAIIAQILISSTTVCFGHEVPDFFYGALQMKLGKNMDKYIGVHSANWLYRGSLDAQFQDVFTMPLYYPPNKPVDSRSKPTVELGTGIYLTTGFRYQEGSSRGAMVVNSSAHIYLAAMAEAATYWHGELLGSRAQLRVLVRDPKNLRYLPAIEQWAHAQPDMRGYVMTLYNLNCKARDIEQCKMPTPAAGASAPLPAH